VRKHKEKSIKKPPCYVISEFTKRKLKFGEVAQLAYTFCYDGRRVKCHYLCMPVKQNQYLTL